MMPTTTVSNGTSALSGSDSGNEARPTLELYKGLSRGSRPLEAPTLQAPVQIDAQEDLVDL